MLDLLHPIQASLRSFADGNLTDNASAFFRTLGYVSERQQPLAEKTFAGFAATFVNDNTSFNQKNALVEQWRAVDLLFQLTESELSEQQVIFNRTVIDDRITSYLFFVIELTAATYSRTALSQITREMNKVFSIPVMVLFKYGECLTLAVIERQPHKRDEAKDVLRKVTLIKDIRCAQPHRAHLEILADLALPKLSGKFNLSNFLELHQAWQKVLDTKELNKRFFKELANWYFWAVSNVTFPADEQPDAAVRNATSVIRLITRLMFVWFLKEKGLVSDKLFEQNQLKDLLHFKGESTYYQAILQNLFFATLNSAMGDRKFMAESVGGRNSQHFVHNVFRYRKAFQQPDATIAELFEPIPFLNGGLFECLDKETDAGRTRVDGFSDHAKNVLRVPDELFFGAERDIELNEVYGTKNKKYKVRGLLNILNSYKFTIAENTPIEEEIALDPELLGKVFENLLANYNPETRTTARKQTGSFYTPREIVNYMVDESLIAYLKTRLQTETEGWSGGFQAFNDTQPSFFGNEMRRQQAFELPLSNNRWHGQDEALESALRALLSYQNAPHPFTVAETEILIKAIDNCKILDPACGSGAFPMGILLKLVHLLEKLDPDNAKWKEWQKLKAIEETKAAYDIGNQSERDHRLKEISEIFEDNSSDYGRKLFLIENCIYGVDIQPIAIQIAKLRFFISLIVDQDFNDDPTRNRGIRPLPNLETKFVAANTLVGVRGEVSHSLFRDARIDEFEKELRDLRTEHFKATNRSKKLAIRKQDEKKRGEFAEYLKTSNQFSTENAERLAKWDVYGQTKAADWFDAEWMFGIDEGFDIVIGNPPYVRQEEIKEFKPLFSKQYECFTGTADLFVYFYERAWRSLREQGVFTFITSNKYFRSGYGAKLRKFLSEKATIKHLIDFGDAPIFTAIAYPSICLATRQKPEANQTRVLTWQSPEAPTDDFSATFQAQSFLMPQKELTGEAWRLESGTTLRLLEKLRNCGKPLGEYVNGKFYYGIKTGLNEAFVVDRATRDCLIEEDKSSAEVLKPFLRGRDVRRWNTEFADQYLIKIESSANKQHPWSGKPIPTAEKIFAQSYPAIHSHLQNYRERLVQREDQGKYFWELRACVYWRVFEEPKIIYPDIYEHQSFAWDSGGYYSVNTTYFIPTKEKWLTGLLNSTLVEWFYASISNRIRGGYLRAFSDYMRQIPIPSATDKQQAVITAIVDKILAAKKADAKADTKQWEAEIDALVYQLYGLTAEEVALVEGGNSSTNHSMAVSPDANSHDGES